MSLNDAKAPTKEEAIESLARHLHWKMEHLDPNGEGEDWPTWESLSLQEQDFNRTCVTALFQDLANARVALGFSGNAPATTL